jgi:hypothetical protein
LPKPQQFTILGFACYIQKPKTTVMNTNKFILAGIVGGIVVLLLGWLTYGILLMDFFNNHAGPAKGVARESDHFLYPYLVLGNLLYGFLLAYVLGKSGGLSVNKGLVTGAIVGFLVSSFYDCISYATTWITSRSSVAADVATFTVISAIGAAVVAWVAGMGKKA